MKKLALGLIAAVAVWGGSASAAPPPTDFARDFWNAAFGVGDPSGYPFRGLYLGVDGGLMWNASTHGIFPNDPPYLWQAGKDPAVAGLHGGYQAQWGNLVLGIEGGATWTIGESFASTQGSGSGTVFGPCGYSPASACQSRISNILSVGPRAGFVMGNWMVYATGGYANALIQTRGLTIATGATFDVGSARHGGWYAGGGVDFLAMKNLILGVEYRHYDFSSAMQNPGPPINNAISVKGNADAILGRLTIKGGG